MVWGLTEIPGGRVSKAWKQVQKQNDDITYFRLKWLIGMDAGRYTDNCWQIVCACAVVFPTKMMKQTIVMSFNDVTRMAHA